MYSSINTPWLRDFPSCSTKEHAVEHCQLFLEYFATISSTVQSFSKLFSYRIINFQYLHKELLLLLFSVLIPVYLTVFTALYAFDYANCLQKFTLYFPWIFASALMNFKTQHTINFLSLFMLLYKRMDYLSFANETKAFQSDIQHNIIFWLDRAFWNVSTFTFLSALIFKPQNINKNFVHFNVKHQITKTTPKRFSDNMSYLMKFAYF